MSCKICEIKEGLITIDAEKQVKEALAQEEKEQIKEEVLDMRLNTCIECEFLTGHTCLKCGCFVKFRAALASKKCPMKKW